MWGLLINSHSICPADSAYLAVGADSSRIAEFCDLEKCKEWTVYAVCEEVERSKAKGDVFVMRPSGEVASIMSGVRCSIKTLEKIFTAPDKASRHRNNSEKVARLMSEQSQSTQLEDLLERATVDEDETRPQHVDPHSGAKYQSIENLRTIVASYVGLSSHQITDQASFGTLGFDSLASIELADELSSSFGIPVAATMLLDADFLTLCHHLGITEGSMPAKKAKATLTTSKAVRPEQKKCAARQKLLEILSQYSVCPMSAIKDDARLEEMGIYSLAKIELKAGIETLFQMNIDDYDFTPESTVKDVLGLLQLSIDGSEESSHDSGTSSSTSHCLMIFTPKSPEVERIQVIPETSDFNFDPIKMLANCNLMFSSSAKDNGFTGHWDVIAPKYDKIVLAYIVKAFVQLRSDLRRI